MKSLIKKFKLMALAVIASSFSMIYATCYGVYVDMCDTDPDSCACKFQVNQKYTSYDATFSVDLAPGLLNANCEDYDEYKWASKGLDKKMFIVGAVHPDFRDVEDCTVDGRWVSEMLGDWQPNEVQMSKIGEDLYAITLKGIPAGIHLAYKYTWGNPGDTWTGTEEFPGNTRIVQIKDNNADHKYSRYDKFGDETTNKDIVNLNYCGDGTVDWDTDVNTPAAGNECAGDKTADAQESFQEYNGINFNYCD
jgi:hypothetical protein